MHLSKKTKKIILGLIISLVASIVAYVFDNTQVFDMSRRDTGTTEIVRVDRIIDGDTIVLSDGRKVRYIGIDTPELARGNMKAECYGAEAALRNKELIEGRDIRLESDISDTDKYGRLLRYVYVGDSMVNEVLVREGYAEAKQYKPDVAFHELFLSDQKQARDEKLGMWERCKK